MAEIRKIRLSDVSVLLPMAEQVRATGPYSDMPWDEDSVRRWLAMSAVMPDMVTFVVEDSGSVHGCLNASISQNPWGARVAIDHAIYSAIPNQFGPLIQSYVEWASERGAHCVMLGNGYGRDGFDRLAARYGFLPSGKLFMLKRRSEL